MALICTFALLPTVSGQPPESTAPKQTEAKAKPKAKKVWTNEDIGSLSGGVNVVGSGAAPEAKNSAGPSVFDRRRPVGPEFRASSLSGETFTSDSVSGSVVLIQFWATWCGYCRRDQANVDAVAGSHRDVITLAVDVGETEQKVQSYLSSSPRSVHVVLEKDTNLVKLFHAGGVPQYVVLDRDGRVVGTHRGYAGEQGLQRLLSKAGPSAPPLD